MLDPVAHDRQTALTQREKCAARARRPSLGLRPRLVRLAPAHSHPDCRCCLTLIGARQSSAVSLTGSRGSCPLPCRPPLVLSTRRLPSLVRVPASPVPRCHQYYEGATTSRSRICGHLWIRFRSPPDPSCFRVRRSAPARSEVPSRPGLWGCRSPAFPASFVWTQMGSLRSPDDPSRAFAPLLDPGRTDVSSPCRPHRCCPRYPYSEGFGNCYFGAHSRSFGTC
jgi:hypothetical protein